MAMLPEAECADGEVRTGVNKNDNNRDVDSLEYKRWQ